MPEPLAELLKETEVLGLDGRPLRLGRFFTERPAALLFVRHFG